MTDFDKWLMKEVDVDRPADWDLVREAFEAGQKSAHVQKILLQNIFADVKIEVKAAQNWLEDDESQDYYWLRGAASTILKRIEMKIKGG